VGQGGVEGAHGVFHGVLPDATAGALDHAGECAGPSDLAASPQVLAIVHGNGEVFIEQSDGLEGVEVADGVVVLADVSLGGVEEGVEALVGGERGRHAEHQFGVDDGEGGVDVWVAEAHFSWVSSLVTTPHRSISVPVPAVVGMATMGSAAVMGLPPPVPPWI